MIIRTKEGSVRVACDVCKMTMTPEFKSSEDARNHAFQKMHFRIKNVPRNRCGEKTVRKNLYVCVKCRIFKERDNKFSEEKGLNKPWYGY